MLNLIGIVGTSLGALLLYGAGKHQRLFPSGALPRMAAWLGVALLLGGGATLSATTAPSTSIFSLIVVAMTVCSLVPLLCAWLRA